MLPGNSHNWYGQTPQEELDHNKAFGVTVKDKDKDVDVWIRDMPVGEIKSDEQSHLSQEYKSPSA